MVITLGFHLFPFRTEKLSPIVPMVLRNSGRVGSRHFKKRAGVVAKAVTPASHLYEGEGATATSPSFCFCLPLFSLHTPHPLPMPRLLPPCLHPQSSASDHRDTQRQAPSSAVRSSPWLLPKQFSYFSLLSTLYAQLSSLPILFCPVR